MDLNRQLRGEMGRSYGRHRKQGSRMTECPNCFEPMTLPDSGETHYCPRCGAKVERQDGIIAGIFGDVQLAVNQYEAGGKPAPGEVQLTESEAEEKWKRDHPEDNSISPQGGRNEEIRCSKCHAIVLTTNAVFCTDCGASLRRKNLGV